MSQHPLDAPQIVENLFFPRAAMKGSVRRGITAVDGVIPVDEDVVLGYRFYPDDRAGQPMLLYFHGNGEVATDYDSLSTLYHDAGAALLVVDYRGYGWSTGTPLTSKMLPDARKVAEALPDILKAHRVEPQTPVFLKGRSLGSAPAVYLAHQYPEQFRGLIIESGYADAPSLFRRLSIPVPDAMREDVHLPVNNVTKMKAVSLPLLVIHGEQDMIIPVEQGQALYEAAPSEKKTLLTVPGAGHNNLLYVATQRYFSAIATFIREQIAPETD